MARLKSRQNFPVGGWMFHQPETGWNSNPWVGFTDVVEQIINHRRANPRFKLSVAREHVEWELEQFTVSRLQSIPSGDQFLINAAQAPPPPNFQPPPQPRARPVAAGGVKKAKAGASLMLDWLGDGLTPAPRDEAEARAKVCVTCPKNTAPNALQKGYSWLASGLGLLIEAKNDLKLATSLDDKLHTCSVCDCSLVLKVHAPMQHVQKNTPEEVRKNLPAHCWIIA